MSKRLDSALRSDLYAALELPSDMADPIGTGELIDIALNEISRRNLAGDPARMLFRNPRFAKAAASNIGEPIPGADNNRNPVIIQLTDALVQLGPETLQACFDASPRGSGWKPHWICGNLFQIAIKRAQPWVFPFLEKNQWGMRPNPDTGKPDPVKLRRNLELALEMSATYGTRETSKDPGSMITWHSRAGAGIMDGFANLAEKGLVEPRAIAQWLIQEIQAAAVRDSDTPKQNRIMNNRLSGERAGHENTGKGKLFPAMNQMTGILHAIQSSPGMVRFMEAYIDGGWLALGTENRGGWLDGRIKQLGEEMLPAALGTAKGLPDLNAPLHPALRTLAETVAEKIIEMSEDENAPPQAFTVSSALAAARAIQNARQILQLREARKIREEVYGKNGDYLDAGTGEARERRKPLETAGTKTETGMENNPHRQVRAIK